jgi:hypothetical protein
MVKRICYVILVVAAGATAPSVAAQYTGRLGTVIGQRAFEASMRGRLDYRRSRCMNAIGSAVFCDCLNGALPLDIDFQQYITVTTADRPDQLPTIDQRLTDAIIATRDMCVARVFTARR